MTIAQYVRLLRDQWVTVLLLTVLGTLGAAVFSFLATPVYEAKTQLFVSTSGQSASLGELTQGSTFTQQRVKSYTDLLTSPRVLAPVTTILDLDLTADDLSQKITATSPLDTVLIDITVQDTSPTRAADIANAVAAQFPEFVDELETRPGQSVSPVKVTVTRPAAPATAPISPRMTLNLALGLLVGLGLGVGTAVLRDSLDRTVGGRTQVAQLVGAPVLGAVTDDPQTPSTPLISHATFSPRAEAYRQLRTNIRFLSIDHRVSSIVVTGSVQSEGKTTTAANLAIALAQSGERVVLIDADLRRPMIADLFGVPSGVGLTTVLLGDIGVDTALQHWRDDLPLFLLTAGPLPPNPSELIGSARMAELVHHLTGHGMTVVVDSPPLLPVTDAAILARVTDGALVVTHVASTKVEQLTTAVEALRTASAPILGVVLNRVPKRSLAYESSAYGSRYTPYTSRQTAAPDLMPATATPLPSPQPVPPGPSDPPGEAFSTPGGHPEIAGVPLVPGEVTLDAMIRPGPATTLLSPVPEAARPGGFAPPEVVGPAGFAPPEVVGPAGFAPPEVVGPAGFAPPEVVDLRQPDVPESRPDTGHAHDRHNGAVPGTVNVNGTVNGAVPGTVNVNGTVNGAVPDAVTSRMDWSQPSPYQQPPQTRPRGRRSATPPDQQP